jgi:hypothetical protein
MFSNFNTVVEGIASGLKTGIEHILYVDPDASEKVFSTFAKFGFAMAGVGIATGLIYAGVRMVRARH